MDIYVHFRDYRISFIIIYNLEGTGRTKNEQSCGKMGRNPSNCENGT